jgi:PAS domain S-box-containing protein
VRLAVANNIQQNSDTSSAQVHALKINPPENKSSEHALNDYALKTSEIRYRRLFETAQIGILIVDAATGKVEDANPFMENKFGYRQSELLGKSLWEIGLVKDKLAYESMFEDLKKNGYVRFDDLPLQTKKGQQKHVEFTCNIYVRTFDNE